MNTILKKLQEATKAGTADKALLEEVANHLKELQHHTDQLEELLIILVRTGWPWNDEGEPNEVFTHSREGYVAAIKEARTVLQLDRSRLTRTEPKT
jgi:hypothetical protein